jgi:hypothetical protein
MIYFIIGFFTPFLIPWIWALAIDVIEFIEDFKK